MASQDSIVSPTLTINGLSDNVLVHIFSYLDVKDKCRAAQVCRRWNNHMHQKSLWKHIDLTPFKVDLRSIWKLVRAYYTDMLLSLRLLGFMESIKTTECISNAVLTDIKTRCPNLKELYITKANLTKIDSSLLPTALKELTLHKCMISVDWFKSAIEANILQNLEGLNLSGTTRTSDATLLDVSKFKQLKVLDLGGCYRIGEPGMAAITQNLNKMVELHLDNCDINDQCLRHVGHHLKDLEVIDLDSCSRITDVGLGSLSILSKLNRLVLKSCGVTKQGVTNFLTVMPKLERLQLSKVEGQFAQEDIAKLGSLKPGLQVELV